MKTKALRLYGKETMQIDSFSLPPLKSGELFLEVVASAVCTSCHKTALLGEDHGRVPSDLIHNPIVLGHEFCGKIVAIGEGLEEEFSLGDSYIVQPMIYREGFEMEAVGHSYSDFGGYATTIRIPSFFIEEKALIRWHEVGAFKAAMAEPLACIIAAFRTQYHTTQKSFKPLYGTKPNGKTLFLGGAGTMGRLAIQLWAHKSQGSAQLVVYGRNLERLDRVASEWRDDSRVTTLLSREKQKLSGEKFDDIVVFAPTEELIDLGLSLLAFDGCLNFFAGPLDTTFSVPVNFHDIHYKRHHIVGSSGASLEDLQKGLELIEEGIINPSSLVAYVGGLDSAKNTILELPQLAAGKKVIYPTITLPLTPLTEFGRLATKNSIFLPVAKAIKEASGLWSAEAEEALLNIRDIKI